jgi:hypothetical protein
MNSLFANVTGSNNVAIGANALISSTGSSDNVAIGRDALKLYTGFPGNVAIGRNALRDLVSNVQNTAVGYQSLEKETGSNNTAFGYASLVSSTAGNDNTAFGSSAGYLLTSGSGNTSIGNNAGYKLTSGSDNIFLGNAFAGNASLNSGDNNILVGSQACYPATPNVSNSITLGNSSHNVLRCAVTTITSLSDERDKEEITDLSAGLDFINEIKPVSFVWKDRNKEGKQGIKDSGFTAQNLKEVQEKYNLVEELKLVYEANPEKLEASYGRLIPILVKAIQELSAEVKELKAK